MSVLNIMKTLFLSKANVLSDFVLLCFVQPKSNCCIKTFFQNKIPFPHSRGSVWTCLWATFNPVHTGSRRVGGSTQWTAAEETVGWVGPGSSLLPFLSLEPAQVSHGVPLIVQVCLKVPHSGDFFLPSV